MDQFVDFLKISYSQSILKCPMSEKEWAWN